ncbi:MAG: NUDIX domain-containing protein [Rhodospirillaceae bacterium]
MSETVPTHNLFAVDPPFHYADAVVAIIVLDDGRYLMQLRDDKPGIFYPDHWGLFGGAVEDGEEPEAALRRELREELDLEPASITYFTNIDLDFAPFGGKVCYRRFYEVPLALADLPKLRLGEGRQMQPVEVHDLLLHRRVTPYDAFALWMHAVAPHWPRS